MRCGKKPVALRHLVAVMKADPQSAMAGVAALCAELGLAPPRPKRTVTKREVETTIARRVRRCVDLYEMVRRHAALELGTDEEQVDRALDDVDSIEAK
jgi:hypothetical protein